LRLTLLASESSRLGADGPVCPAPKLLRLSLGVVLPLVLVSIRGIERSGQTSYSAPIYHTSDIGLAAFVSTATELASIPFALHLRRNEYRYTLLE
jgi:hypothetical protein